MSAALHLRVSETGLRSHKPKTAGEVTSTPGLDRLKIYLWFNLPKSWETIEYETCSFFVILFVSLIATLAFSNECF